jgi:hypothetical protein
MNHINLHTHYRTLGAISTIRKSSTIEFTDQTFFVAIIKEIQYESEKDRVKIHTLIKDTATGISHLQILQNQSYNKKRLPHTFNLSSTTPPCPLHRAGSNLEVR